MTEDQIFAFQLDTELAERIDAAAQLEGRTRSSFIRHWLRIALGEEEQIRQYEAGVAEVEQ